MICENCRNEIPDNVKFCGYCGQKYEVVEEDPVVKDSVGQDSAEQAVADKEPVELEPIEQAPADKVPVELEPIEQAPAEKDPSKLSAAINPSKKNVRKKRTGLFMFILSFSLFTGIMGGMCGAYVVAKHGWEVVPFAEKLTFIPFVKLKKEKMDIYTVPIDELMDIEDDKESDIENE